MEQTNDTLQINGRENLWARAVSMETGIQVASCYQCLRCSNSCPVSTFMDIKPHQIVRLVQLGQKEKLLKCSAIWICLSCEMCTTYCPNEIDVAALLNHLKNSVVCSQITPAEYEIAAFHEVFMDVLQKHGRMNDLQLMQRFRFKTVSHGHLPSCDEMSDDISLALELLKRRRLRLFPERSRAANEIKRVLRQHGHKGVSS
ncbi:MAG: 4Fe-4S dicluster domain-containing protein [Desulfoferrobacter sp.]